MAMMVGIGPFITIPVFLDKLGGPQAMLGWFLGALVALADGLVWSELAAAFPGSGGTYHFYDAVYGKSRLGRLLKFLFVWQFLFSAPLELASGAIGMAQYAGFLWPVFKQPAWIGSWPWLDWEVSRGQILAVGLMLAITALAYRRIEVAGRLMVVLWAGMLVTVVWVIAAGLTRFDAGRALDIPAGALTVNRSFVLGLGAVLGLAMYNYLGYYQVCYLGDEVADAPRTLPRSILVSVLVVAALYVTINLSVLGALPWREVRASHHVASDLMLQIHGPTAARLVTLLIVWTAAAGTFAGLLGYSRVPYAAAASGHFFRGLARTHPTGDFPHRSLLLISALAALACLAHLETVIAALLTSRILIQFVGQIATVFVLHRSPGQLARMPFRMAFFPLPALIALAGWLYVFGTSEGHIIVYGLGSLLLGALVFAVWDTMAARSRLD
jgi:amino acid transporter